MTPEEQSVQLQGAIEALKKSPDYIEEINELILSFMRD